MWLSVMLLKAAVCDIICIPDELTTPSMFYLYANSLCMRHVFMFAFYILPFLILKLFCMRFWTFFNSKGRKLCVTDFVMM